MHFLVDGYNYLHRAGLFRSLSLEEARRRLATRLRILGRSGDKVTIVWDARRSPPGLPARETTREVEHEFARLAASADEAILGHLRAADEPRSYCVVSDDREVTGSARQLGAAVRSVGEIETRVARSPGARPGGDEPEEEKPPAPRGKEVDGWLRAFGEPPRPTDPSERGP